MEYKVNSFDNSHHYIWVYYLEQALWNRPLIQALKNDTHLTWGGFQEYIIWYFSKYNYYTQSDICSLQQVLWNSSNLHYQRYMWYFHVEEIVYLLSLTISLIVKKSSFLP